MAQLDRFYIAILAKPMVERYEGRRSSVYTDTTGHRTVGIGFNMDRAGARDLLASVGHDWRHVRDGLDELTDEAIDALFLTTFVTAEIDVEFLIKNYDDLPLDARIILADMAFSMGCNSLGKFKRMIAAFEARNFERAADEMLKSKWGRTSPRAAHHAAKIRVLASTNEMIRAGIEDIKAGRTRTLSADELGS